MTQSRPPAPSEPTGRRRRRALSEEERALWEGVARQVRPLRPEPATMAEPPAQRPQDAAAPAPPARPPNPTPELKKPALPPLLPLPRRERSRLSRGKAKIDARIDLHGLSQARAHRALLGFLKAAHGDGLTMVLVITGKGTAGGAEDGRGVLRRQVPHWLGLPELRAVVAGVAPAHLSHGGEGALYVRIRRARPRVG